MMTQSKTKIKMSKHFKKIDSLFLSDWKIRVTLVFLVDAALVLSRVFRI